MRIKAKAVAAGTYHIDSPYGSFDITSDGPGTAVNLGPNDVLCLQSAINGPCDFASILGVSPTDTDLGNFLHGTGFPAGYFGNGAGTSVVTGGNNVGTPDGLGGTTFAPVNTLTVTAPNGTRNSTDQWTITGKQFDPNAAPIAPLPAPPPVQGPKPPAPAATGGNTGGTTTQVIERTVLRLIPGAGQGVLGSTAQSPAVSRLTLASRISITRLRAQGLRTSMRVQEGTNVVRFGIYKARGGQKTGRALFTTTRTPTKAGLFPVTLRSSKLSKLKPGAYVLEARAGRSAASLGALRQIAFTITK
jgi:hypothetical protein